MKLTVKRLLALILALTMAMSLCAGAWAAEVDPADAPAHVTTLNGKSGKCGENVTWVLDGDTLTISGTGAMADFDGGEDISWSEERDQITKVVIEKGVTTIGEMAFFYCSNLKSVTIPNTVTKIGYQAFHACRQLSDVTIPSGVKVIGDYAFDETALSSVSLPASVTSVGYLAFANGPKLKKVSLGKGVKSVDKSAFSGSDVLEAITVASGNKTYSAQGGALYDAAKKKLILCPEGKKGTLTLPKSTVTIEKYACMGCEKLTKVVIPSGVKTIGESAFEYCSALKSLTIPASVTKIGDYAYGVQSTAYGDEDDYYYPIKGDVIYGYKNSAAEKYAKNNKVTFKALLPKTTLSSVKNVKGKKMTVKWKKNTKGKGYQIQYSTDKNFKKGNKTVKIGKNSTTSKTISKLKKGKTYYVRIRTVNGSNTSDWSGVKSVKIKK